MKKRNLLPLKIINRCIPEVVAEKEKQKELQQMVKKRREEEKDIRLQRIQELQKKKKTSENNQ